MLAGFDLEATCAFVVQRELHDVAFHRIGGRTRVGEHFTGYDRTRIEHVEREEALRAGDERIDAPAHHLTGRHGAEDGRQRERALDGGIRRFRHDVLTGDLPGLHVRAEQTADNGRRCRACRIGARGSDSLARRVLGGIGLLREQRGGAGLLRGVSRGLRF